MTYFQPTCTGYILKIQVVPGSAVTKVVGLYGDRLKIRVAAPPEKGEANAALLAFLARVLEVPRSQVKLKGGARDRAKVVEVADLDPGLRQRLEAIIPPGAAQTP